MNTKTEDEHFMLEGAAEFATAHFDCVHSLSHRYVFDEERLLVFLKRVLDAGYRLGSGQTNQIEGTIKRG